MCPLILIWQLPWIIRSRTLCSSSSPINPFPPGSVNRNLLAVNREGTGPSGVGCNSALQRRQDGDLGNS